MFFFIDNWGSDEESSNNMSLEGTDTGKVYDADTGACSLPSANLGTTSKKCSAEDASLEFIVGEYAE